MAYNAEIKSKKYVVEIVTRGRKGIDGEGKDFQPEIDELNSDINELQLEDESINSKIDNLSNRLNTAENNISTNETNISNNTDAINNLNPSGDKDFNIYSTGFIQASDGEQLYVNATGLGTVTVQLPYMDGTKQSSVIAIGDYNGTFNSTDYVSIFDNSFTQKIEDIITPNKIIYVKYIDNVVGWKIVGEDKESVYDEYVVNIHENVGPVNVLEGQRWLLDATFADSNVILPNPSTFKDSQSMPISIGDYNGSADDVNNFIDIYDYENVLIERINTSNRYITLQYLGINVGWKIIEDLNKGRIDNIESSISSLQSEVDLNSRLITARSFTPVSVPTLNTSNTVTSEGVVLTFDATSNELFDIANDGVITILKEKDNINATFEAHFNKTGGSTDEILFWAEYSIDNGVNWQLTVYPLRRQNIVNDGDGVKLIDLSIDTVSPANTKFRLKVGRINSSGTITIDNPAPIIFADTTLTGFARKLTLR